MLSMETGYLLMVAGAALVPCARVRAIAALAAWAGVLALAGLTAAPIRTGLDAGFMAATAGLLLVGALLGAGAAGRAWRIGSPLARSGGAALLVGAGAMVWGGARVLRSATPGLTVLSFLIVSGCGVALVLAGRRWRWNGGAYLPTPSRPLVGVAGLVAGAAAAAAGPDLGLISVGVIVAGWAGYFLQRAAGRSRVPAAATLTLLLLPAWWLMATVAGAEGLSAGSLGVLPLSPAAERLLAPALLLAGWALAGLWPLHRQMPGPLTAPVGALLVARVAVPAVPEGLAHWQALAMPLVVAGVWHAALTRRWALIAVGLAWVGLLAPEGRGLTGAGLLLAAALLLELAEPIGGSDPSRATLLRLVTGLAAGGGALLAISAALRGEVVYTVVAAGAAAVAAGRALGRQASTAREPRTVVPSA